MSRKMVYIGLTFIIALFLTSFLTLEEKLYIIIAMMVLVVPLFFIFKNKRKEIATIIIVAILAFGYNISYTALNYEKALTFSGEIVSFQGKKIYEKKLNSGDLLCYLDGEINGEYKTKIAVFIPDVDFDYNDKITLTVQLESPENSYNFKSYDYLKAKGIFLQSNIVYDYKIEKNNAFSFLNLLDNFNEQIIFQITDVLQGEEGELLSSMLAGEKDVLSPSIKYLFQEIGVSHILAVSGTHLMLLSAILIYILSKVAVKKYIKFALVETFVLTFVMFTGASMSTIRAGIMITILMLGDLFNKKSDPLTSISVAGLLILVFNPYAVRDPSFLLSFLGVFSVVIIAPKICKKIPVNLRKILSPIIVSLTITVVTFPILLLYFDRVSIIQPLSNVIITPLCVIGLAFGFIFIFFSMVPFFSSFLLIVSGIFLKTALIIAEFLANLPYTSFPIGFKILPVLVAGVIVFSFILFLIFRKDKFMMIYQILGIFVIIITISFYSFIKNSPLKIVLFIENNAVSMAIKSEEEIIVLDLAGSGKSSTTISRYLDRSTNIDTISLVLINNEQVSLSKYLHNINKKVKDIYFANETFVTLPNRKINYINSNETLMVSGVEVDFDDNFNFIVSDGENEILLRKIQKISFENLQKNDFVIDISNKMKTLFYDENYFQLADESAVVIEIYDDELIVRSLDYALFE